MTADARAGKLEQLRRLAAAPAEQAAFAAQLLERERNPEVVLAALAVLAAAGDPAWRLALLRAYAHYDANGPRRDPGGAVRAAVLRALRPVALPEDAPLLERAAATYEFLFGEAAGDLRAAALLALAAVDAALAGYHAVRLLTDRHTSIMSGEPAVTAVRVLAAQGQLLPLYAYVSRDADGAGDVVAECLRSLALLPASLLPVLIARFGGSQDEIVLLGLFDLLLAHATRAAHLPFMLDFLRETRLYNIYRYLTAALVAGGDEAASAALTALAAGEPDRQKRELLAAALALRPPSGRRAHGRRGA
jgi:hypothetical protein